MIFVITAKGHLEIVDTEYSVRTAKAIIENGTMLIEPIFKDERNNIPLVPGTDKIYSQYGIGILAIFIPVILMAKLFSFALGLDETLLSHFILSFYNIPFAILGLWNFREILKALGQNTKISNFLMICLGVGTIFWKYVVTDFSEICQIAFILGAINSYLCKGNKNRWIFISGYLSLLILIKLLYVVVIPPFLILAFLEAARDRMLFKKLFHGAFFLVPAGLFLMFMNWIRYGSIFESGYGNSQTAFSLIYFQRDWKDYLFSFERGIIPYSPLILASILTLKCFYNKNKEAFFLIFSISSVLFILFTSWVGWKGGYCWGNRNLVPIVPLLCICWAFLDFTSRKQNFIFMILLSISIPLQIISISVKTHEWSVLSREFKDHHDPYYVPNTIKGTFLLFKEKIINSTGVYKAENFVSEHRHSINLKDYESFTGFNFWIVHLLKYLNAESFLTIMGNITLITVTTISAYLLMNFSIKF